MTKKRSEIYYLAIPRRNPEGKNTTLPPDTYHEIGDQASRLSFRLDVVHFCLSGALDANFRLPHILPSVTGITNETLKLFT